MSASYRTINLGWTDFNSRTRALGSVLPCRGWMIVKGDNVSPEPVYGGSVDDPATTSFTSDVD